VSNLTNLLAFDRLGLSFGEYAGRMWAPALAAVVVTCLLLAVRYRRELRGEYRLPRRRRPADPVSFWACTGACLLVVPAFAVGLPVWVVNSAAAAVLVVLYAVRRPAWLGPALLPWRLVVFAEGLFLVVETLDRWGLLQALAGVGGTGVAEALRTAAATAGLSNLVDNLPAYYAMESAAEDPTRALAVPLGANLAPLVLLWGRWRRWCSANAAAPAVVEVSAAEFATIGVVGVPPLLAATL